MAVTRSRLLAAFALSLGAGCIDNHPATDLACVECDAADAGAQGETGDPAPGDPMDQPACLDALPLLDLLLVIDDSGSMCEEQDALGKAFDAFHDAIGAWDWRLAVVTTDMHPDNGFRGAFGPPTALPVPSLNCIDGEGDPAVPDTEDCRDVDGLSVLDSQLFERDEQARRFRCMVNQGTQGDGFEKPLAAAELALSCDGPNADLLVPCGADDPQFLRPGAALAVIYIGDEDDCSDPASTPDLRRACEARGDAARCEIPRTENNSCVWFADDLTPVATFVDRLRRANPAAAGVTALALTGSRFAPIDGQPVRFVPGEAEQACVDVDGYPLVNAECCPEGVCASSIATVCEGAFGAAFAGNRLRTLAEAFPGGCIGRDCDSICEPDDMVGLAEQLVLKVEAALPPRCE